MASTKKLLVAFDPAKPEARSNDFLIPWEQNGEQEFLGLKSGKQHALGMMIFLGRSVTENDLFAKLVDSGTFVPDVDATLALLRSYIDQIKTMKIGNIVRLATSDADSKSDVELELVANTPSAAAQE